MIWLTNDKNEVIKNLLACIILVLCFFAFLLYFIYY